MITEGNRTDYTYDDLKRQLTVTRAGVITSNVFDAADRVIATYRNGVLVSSNTYNTAGELTVTHFFPVVEMAELASHEFRGFGRGGVAVCGRIAAVRS